MNLFSRSAAREFMRQGRIAGLSAAALFSLALPISARLIPRGEVVLPVNPDSGLGLAPLAGQGVVVAWLEMGREVLRAQELNADLSARRDFVVADTHEGPAALLFCPQIARIGQRRLAFAWSELNIASRRFRTAYRVMNEDGSPRSPIRYAQGDPPLLDEGCPRLSGGDTGFVIAWNLSLHPVGPPYGLRARTFSVRGIPISSPIDLATSASITEPAWVVARHDGEFAAAWSPRGHDESREIFLRRFGRTGTPLGRAVRIAPDRLELQGLVAGTDEGYELIWSLRQGLDSRSVLARRFDRNLVAITPARTVFTSETYVEATAVIDRKARTALLAATGSSVQGLELDPELDARRCGAAIRVNDELPQSTFPVVVSAPGEVVVAGLEVAASGPYLLKLIVRRYALGACAAAP
ncbi:MAG TPA: hypothetical protein VN851_26520 [Thermoanaerobaculia bacterium]|nr:hypothetical protein [Thermoanaerobaculia bacterium]